jgi:hypothetical protein
MRLAHDLRLPIFRDLHAQVTPFALRRILSQWRLLASIPTALPRCTNSFTTSMGLPCAHRIQARIYSEAPYILKLKDVHPHWRFTKLARLVTANNEPEVASEPIDPVLLVQNPPIARARGRPAGSTAAVARTRREQQLEDSTQREPSQFERVEAHLQQRAEQELGQTQARGRGRGGRARGGGRGRGLGRGGRGGGGGEAPAEPLSEH